MYQRDISVIMTTYNGAKFITMQLDSILAQEVHPYEIIICDDHSTDETIPILNTYLPDSKIKLVINGERLGVVENFKKAAKLAQPGNWLAFADQDDIWVPHKLKRLAEEMQVLDDGVKPALIFTDLTVIDKNGGIVSTSFWDRQKIVPRKVDFNALMYGNIVTGCTMMINYAMAEDFFCMNKNKYLHDEWLALIAYSFGNVKFLNDKLVLYRQHEANITYSENFKAPGIINKIKLDIDYLLGNKKFLPHQFNLASDFLVAYQDRLDSHQLKIINSFIRLGNKNYLLQRINRFISYWRNAGTK